MKRNARKIGLNRETLRALESQDDLRAAAGGTGLTCPSLTCVTDCLQRTCPTHAPCEP